MAIKFLLASTGVKITMVSTWTDEVYCSILKDGSISLRASIEDEHVSGGRLWFPSHRGIKTPKQFVDAFYGVTVNIDHDWSVQKDILPVLFKYVPLFSSLTNLYIEIDHDRGKEDLGFFLFCQKVILSSDVELPDDFKSAAKIVEFVYDFVDAQFQSTGRLPRGKHVLMGKSISFPSRAVRSNKDYREFKKKQTFETHIKNAEWKIEQTGNHRSDYYRRSEQSQRVSDFCREYVEQHNKLPIGTFKIGITMVTFNGETKSH